MKALLALGSFAALAACSAPEEAGVSVDPESASQVDATDETVEAEMPSDFAGTAWRVNDEEGARYTTFLDPGGRYRDHRNGDPFQEGAWEIDAEERICFTPDDEEGDAGDDAPGADGDAETDGDRSAVNRTCWRPDRMASDDTLLLHSQSGRRIRATKVDYTGPNAPEDDEPGSSES